jgi:hypothetical protein
LSVVSGSWGLFVCFRDFFCNAFVYFILLIVACIAGESNCIRYPSGINFDDGQFRVQHLQEFIPGLLALKAGGVTYNNPIASLIFAFCRQIVWVLVYFNFSLSSQRVIGLAKLLLHPIKLPLLLVLVIPFFPDKLLEPLFLFLSQLNFSRVATVPAQLHELRDVADLGLPTGLPVSDNALRTRFHILPLHTLFSVYQKIKNFHNVFKIKKPSFYFSVGSFS